MQRSDGRRKQTYTQSGVIRHMTATQGWPELKELLAEASRALARLDAERLEKLVISCHALNCGLAGKEAECPLPGLSEPRAIAHEMRTFARVMEMTRANWDFIHGLRAMGEDQLEYGPVTRQGWMRTRSARGNN